MFPVGSALLRRLTWGAVHPWSCFLDSQGDGDSWLPWPEPWLVVIESCWLDSVETVVRQVSRFPTKDQATMHSTLLVS